MKFKILVGRHVSGNRKDGNQRVYRARTKDNIIETDVDLCAKFNQPGSVKFERIYDNPQYITQPPVQQAFVTQQAVQEVPVAKVDQEVKEPSLYSMTVVELRRMAEELEIDLGDARTKAEIIEAIELAQDY